MDLNGSCAQTAERPPCRATASTSASGWGMSHTASTAASAPLKRERRE